MKKPMTQDNKPKKLASYKTLMAQWRAERRRALLVAGAQILLIAAVLAALRFAFTDFPNLPSWPKWMAISLGFAFTLGAPVYLVCLGSKPRPEDVEENRALRRACGMDDSVEYDDAP